MPDDTLPPINHYTCYLCGKTWAYTGDRPNFKCMCQDDDPQKPLDYALFI